MSSLRREAMWWIGGALLLALLIAGIAALFLPSLDALSFRYAVL